jgi:hypothetical protein
MIIVVVIMIIVVTIRQLSSLQKVWSNAYVAWVCLRAGLRADLSATYATTIWTYARVRVWDSLTRHLRDLNCPKCGFPERNCLRGRLGHVDRNAYAWAYATHLSPKCLRQLRKPRVLLTPDSHDTTLTNQMKGGFGPFSSSRSRETNNVIKAIN